MAKKISIIIPSYNGKQLLKENIPAVIKFFPDCEIIVVDDASSDESVKFLKENFKDIKFIENIKNRGFAQSVNTAAKEAQGDFIILLNSDVKPNINFVKLVLNHFRDKNLFAVGLADRSHERGKVILRGRGGANFTKGFVNHFKLPSLAGETFWVSGGSSVIDKEKFHMLGGFNPIFAPFYWEDIDLSFRAQRLGFKCDFEPKAIVDHYHEKGAIKENHSKFFIKTVSYKNQFLFVWKNIDDYILITKHLLWLPYHFTKSILTFNLPFFAGFIWAVLQIPQLIINYQTTETSDYKITTSEVLQNFEKQQRTLEIK